MRVRTRKKVRYELALMSSLPVSGKPLIGKIYLSESGYVVRNQEGVHRGNLDTIDLKNLEKRLKDRKLKSAILKVTTANGHTQTINLYFDAIYTSSMRDDSNVRELIDQDNHIDDELDKKPYIIFTMPYMKQVWKDWGTQKAKKRFMHEVYLSDKKVKALVHLGRLKYDTKNDYVAIIIKGDRKVAQAIELFMELPEYKLRTANSNTNLVLFQHLKELKVLCEKRHNDKQRQVPKISQCIDLFEQVGCALYLQPVCKPPYEEINKFLLYLYWDTNTDDFFYYIEGQHFSLFENNNQEDSNSGTEDSNSEHKDTIENKNQQASGLYDLTLLENNNQEDSNSGTEDSNSESEDNNENKNQQDSWLNDLKSALREEFRLAQKQNLPRLCLDIKICDAVLEITSKRRHTEANNSGKKLDLNLVTKISFNPTILVTRINSNAKSKTWYVLKRPRSNRSISDFEVANGLIYLLLLGYCHPILMGAHDKNGKRIGAFIRYYRNYQSMNNYLRVENRISAEVIVLSEMIKIVIACYAGKEYDAHGGNIGFVEFKKKSGNETVKLCVKIDDDRSAWPIVCKYFPFFTPTQAMRAFPITEEAVNNLLKLITPTSWEWDRESTFEKNWEEKINSNEKLKKKFHNDAHYILLKLILMPDEFYIAVSEAAFSSGAKQDAFIKEKITSNNDWKSFLIEYTPFMQYIVHERTNAIKSILKEFQQFNNIFKKPKYEYLRIDLENVLNEFNKVCDIILKKYYVKFTPVTFESLSINILPDTLETAETNDSDDDDLLLPIAEDLEEFCIDESLYYSDHSTSHPSLKPEHTLSNVRKHQTDSSSVDSNKKQTQFNSGVFKMFPPKPTETKTTETGKRKAEAEIIHDTNKFQKTESTISNYSEQESFGPQNEENNNQDNRLVVNIPETESDMTLDPFEIDSFDPSDPFGIIDFVDDRDDELPVPKDNNTQSSKFNF